jgi:16S rRNA (cytosine967-C5)-methyltransferase
MTRELAWEILRSNSSVPTREVPAVALRAGLDSRDRGLLARMVRTEVQRRASLQALVHAFARGKPNRDLSAFLRLGFAQLFFMDRVPSHAAVSETVRAASDQLGLSKGKYVNGVLRTALRASRAELSGDPRRDLIGRDLSFEEPVFKDPEEHPYLWAEDALSIPAPLFKGWVKRFGLELATELAKDCLDDPRLSLRVVRGKREELQAELLTHQVSTSRGEHDSILTVEPGDLEPTLSSPAFVEGRLTVQGEAALRAAELCGAREDERWLDLCAAPGGKTAVLAATGASVLACDVSESKLERVGETLDRLQLSANVRTLLLPEGREPPAEEFDGVLLDVPCSNTGVLARRPDARWRWGPQSRKAIGEIQATILRRGACCVRAGGALVYSTCSIEPDENQQRVRGFLEEHADWSLEEQHLVFPRPSQPAGSIDGGFAARLRRS